MFRHLNFWHWSKWRHAWVTSYTDSFPRHRGYWRYHFGDESKAWLALKNIGDFDGWFNPSQIQRLMILRPFPLPYLSSLECLMYPDLPWLAPNWSILFCKQTWNETQMFQIHLCQPSWKSRCPKSNQFVVFVQCLEATLRGHGTLQPLLRGIPKSALGTSRGQ